MNSDWNIILFLGVLVIFLAISTEYLARKNKLPQWLARKILHVGAVGACAVAPALLQSLTILTWIVLLTEPLLLFLVGTGRLFSEENGRKSWGIALFPLAYLVLLFTFYNERWLIITPMAILALSDAMAAVFGHLFAKKYYTLTGDRKSFVGSSAFAISVPLVFLIVNLSFPAYFNQFIFIKLEFWIGLAGIAILLAALEALGSNGFDNWWIPLGAALLLQQLVNQADSNLILSLWVGILISIPFIYYTYHKKSLTLDGAVVASLLGLWVLWFAGPVWLIPLFFFFITSTLLGRFNKNKIEASDMKQGKARDAWQVLCNGGIYAVLATFAHHDIVLHFMIISIAICTSDTWSSEIGIYYHWKTYDILRMRPVPVGLSGGVSLPGTIGGLGGAFAMSILGNILISNQLYINFIFYITIFGFAGMLLDSILGAGLQARYKNLQNHDISDSAGEHQVLHSGWRWMTNDVVNMLSNLIVIVLCILLYL